MGVRARWRRSGARGAGTNLVTLEGSLPRVGEPGHTLGGRVLPGYGFPETEGSEPIKTSPPPQPTAGSAGAGEQVDNPYLANPGAIAEAEGIYRTRCLGCHKSSGGSGPNIFGTRLGARSFIEAVFVGSDGMPSFRELLSQDEILKLHALSVTRSRL